MSSDMIKVVGKKAADAVFFRNPEMKKMVIVYWLMHIFVAVMLFIAKLYLIGAGIEYRKLCCFISEGNWTAGVSFLSALIIFTLMRFIVRKEKFIPKSLKINKPFFVWLLGCVVLLLIILLTICAVFMLSSVVLENFVSQENVNIISSILTFFITCPLCFWTGLTLPQIAKDESFSFIKGMKKGFNSLRMSFAPKIVYCFFKSSILFSLFFLTGIILLFALGVLTNASLDKIYFMEAFAVGNLTVVFAIVQLYSALFFSYYFNAVEVEESVQSE